MYVYTSYIYIYIYICTCRQLGRLERRRYGGALLEAEGLRVPAGQPGA